MSDQFKTDVARAIFYVTVAREKLERIKDAVAKHAIEEREVDAMTPQQIADGLERAIYADTIFKALLGFEVIQTRLEIAAKLPGSLAIQQMGKIIGVGIKKDAEITPHDLAIVMPSEAMADPMQLIAALLTGGKPECQCPKCQAKRSEG
jgi:hypothetical protein